MSGGMGEQCPREHRHPGRTRAATFDSRSSLVASLASDGGRWTMKSVEKMRADGVADLAIRNFTHNYELLAAGDAGMLAESEIEPVEDVPDAEHLPGGGDAAREALDRTVVVKLNGGLGTSMGMTRPSRCSRSRTGCRSST